MLFATAEGEDLTENMFLDYKNFFHKQYFKSYYSFLHSGYHVKYFTTRNIIIQVTMIPPNTIHLSCWEKKERSDQLISDNFIPKCKTDDIFCGSILCLVQLVSLFVSYKISNTKDCVWPHFPQCNISSQSKLTHMQKMEK